jgi:ArsR family transcriptional regulator, cadmium/lead-responsive transcriptional repressor
MLLVVSSTDLRLTFFRGISDRSRLLILEQLAEGERRVSDLVEATGLSQPNVSAHLACLWDCGLVARERRGREMHYRLIPGMRQLFRASDAVLAKAGETVGACPRYADVRKTA